MIFNSLLSFIFIFYTFYFFRFPIDIFRGVPSTSVSGTITRRTAQPTKRKSVAERILANSNDSYMNNNHNNYNGNNSDNQTQKIDSSNNNKNIYSNRNHQNGGSNNSVSRDRNEWDASSIGISVSGVAGLRALKIQKGGLW